jgi:Domain of unknown function (DUF1707).
MGGVGRTLIAVTDLDTPDRRRLLRASDADRDAVTERLRVAAGQGRITLEELEERLEGVYAAKTYADLDRLVEDLPPPEGAEYGAPPLVLENRTGVIKQAGHWVVPERITVRSTMGHVTVDFTRAECRHREVHLEAHVGSGYVLIVVPRNWAAVIDGIANSMGHVSNKAAPVQGTEVTTTLRVNGTVGTGLLKIKRSRR